jgi:hypothetical protein
VLTAGAISPDPRWHAPRSIRHRNVATIGRDATSGFGWHARRANRRRKKVGAGFSVGSGSVWHATGAIGSGWHATGATGENAA